MRREERWVGGGVGGGGGRGEGGGGWWGVGWGEKGLGGKNCSGGSSFPTALSPFEEDRKKHT